MQPAYALRPSSTENRTPSELAAGMEENGKARKRIIYDPEEVAVRLLKALVNLGPLTDREFFSPKTGEVTLNTAEAADLLGNGPTSAGLRQARGNGRSLAEEVNARLSAPEMASEALAAQWQLLFQRGVSKAGIAKSRQVDTRPWTNRRLSLVVKAARGKGLSLHQQTIYGPQSDSLLGRELKSAHQQVTKTDKFPEYNRSWAIFLAALGVPQKEAYTLRYPPRQRLSLAAYVDLERDENGLLILDARKKVADLKMNQLKDLWKKPKVRRAKTLFLVGAKTWPSRERYLVFGHASGLYATNIPVEQFRPEDPFLLALEIAVADPHHEVQAASRLDTGEQVYPFEGQMRFYLDPPFENGRVQEGALFFRTFSWPPRSKFWKEVARINPKTVIATHVKTRRLKKRKTAKVYFNVGTGPKSTTLTYHKREGLPLLTVRLDPKTGEPLQAWKMGPDEPVFPRSDARLSSYKVFADPKLAPNGLVAQNPQANPGVEVVNAPWARVWRQVVQPDTRTVVVQGAVPFEEAPYKQLVFFFAGELFPTAIPIGETPPSLQISFLAQDPYRRPQEVHRMDTGEVVYPAPNHRKVVVDPVLENGRVISGKLYKAASQISSKSVQAALRMAQQRVVFVNMSIFDRAGKIGFWDPVARKRRSTSLPYQPGVSITGVAEKVGKKKWAIARVYDGAGREIFPTGREVIARTKIKLLDKKAPTSDRVLAAEQLFRLGALDIPNGVTTPLLQDVLSDYHQQIFGRVGAEPFMRLSNRAARRYEAEPGKFWQIVFHPLQEAEHLPPLQAERRLGAAAQTVAAGAEEIRRFDAEGFATRFPEQAKRVPAGAGRIAVVPEGTVFRLYRPETLASGVEEWAAAHRLELPGVEIRAEPIPARLFQVERPAVFLWDPMLGPLPYEPSVPVVQQWAGQPIPYRADGLFSLALWGPGATPTRLIAAWTFEKDGRQFLAIAVSA